MKEKQLLRKSMELAAMHHMVCKETNKERKLPLVAGVIEKLQNLLETGKGQVSVRDGCRMAAIELFDFWVFDGNVHRSKLQHIEDQIYNDFKAFVSLKNYPRFKRGDKWTSDVSMFNDRMMQYNYHIRTSGKQYQSNNLNEECRVTITEETAKFCTNNCVGEQNMQSGHINSTSLKRKSINETGEPELDIKRTVSLEEKLLKNATNNTTEFFSTSVGDDCDCDSDLETSTSHKTPSVDPTPQIESPNSVSKESNHESTKTIPWIPLRSSLDGFNESVIKCLAQISVDYCLPIDTSISIVCDVANVIFGQSWKKKTHYETCSAIE